MGARSRCSGASSYSEVVYLKVSVDEAGFTGPIGLLLELISAQRIDLWQVSISKLVDEYLSRVDEIIAFDLEGASEFLSVAATLVAMKSRRLLPPKQVDDDTDEEFTRERELLLIKMLELKIYKDASTSLADQLTLASKSLARRGSFPKELLLKLSDPLSEVTTKDLFDKIKAIMLAQPRSIVDDSHLFQRRIDSEMLRKRTISELEQRKQMGFSELVGWSESRLEVVATFLLLLEGYRLGIFELNQPELLGDLWVVWLGWISERAKQEMDSLLEALS